MKKIRQKKHSEEYEQILLSYTEMCYSVALALTNNPYDARFLTRDVLTNAWHRHYNVDRTDSIKHILLKSLRKRYLKYYRNTSSLLPNESTPKAEALSYYGNCGRDY